MATGRITTLRTDRGFGFIAESPGAESDNELFFHRTALINAVFASLAEGQEVTFTTEPDPRDPSRFRARDVRVVNGE